MTGKEIDVLLVEDDMGDVELTRAALADSKLTLRLHVVNDGEEALKFLRRKPPFEAAPRPDLIILDLNLPRIDGREVLREVKCDELLRAIPICVVTTSDAQTDVLKSYGLGANCYVTKPIGLDMFLRVIKAIEDFWLTIVRLPPEHRTILPHPCDRPETRRGRPSSSPPPG